MASPRSSAAKAPPAAPEPASLRLARGLAVLVAVVAPLVVYSPGMDAFRQPKLFASALLALASVTALVWYWARQAGSAAPGPLPPVLAVALPLLVVAASSLLTSTHPAHTREGLLSFTVGLAALVAWSLGFRGDPLDRLLDLLVFPAVVFAGLAVLQFHDLYQPFAFARPIEGTRLAVTSLAGNAGELGGYLVLPALLAQRGLQRGRRRALWGFALAVLVYGMVASQTLTALAALAGGSALLWLQVVPRPRRWGVAAGGLVALVVLFLTLPPLRERFDAVREGVTVGRVNAALSGRLDGWRAALWMVGQHPWTGVGHGAYAAEFVPARFALMAQGVEFYPGHKDSFFDHAHNDFLETAAEWGLPGLLVMAWSAWVLVRRVLPRLAGQPEEHNFASAVLVSLGLLALAYFPLHVALMAYPYLFFFAWLFRRSRELEEVQ